MQNSLALLSALTLVPAVSWAWTPFAFDRGNLKYEKKEYELSSQFYHEALDLSVDNPKIHYNLGNSLYRNGRYEEAKEEFLAALKSEDRTLRDRALYNLGNTRFRLGDLPGAIQSYEQALSLDSTNEKARLNRDYVKRLLEEKKKEDQKQEEQKQEGEKREDDKEENKEGGKGQDQEEKKEEEETKKEEKEKEGEKEPEEAKPEEETPAEEKPQEKEPTQKISPDEGEALLESLEDDRSGAIRKMVERHTKKKETEIEKDW